MSRKILKHYEKSRERYKNILSEQDQQDLIESISNYFTYKDTDPTEPVNIIIQPSGTGKATACVKYTLLTLQNQIIPLFNEASEGSERALKYNSDYTYYKQQGMKEAYKTVIDLIQNMLQKVEKEGVEL